MISMINKQEIILRYVREGDSLRKICRDLGLNRKTVKHYITEYFEAKKQSEAAGTTEILHRSVTEAPGYHCKVPRPKKKATPALVEAIDGFLADNDRKAMDGLSKQRMLKKDIHEALVEQGYKIGYTTVCSCINERILHVREAFIRQEYQAGSVCEFDWAEVKLVIGGTQKRLYIALFTSAYSNYRFGMIFHRQDQLAFMESHRAFFAHIGGVYQEMVYDNMRVVIAQFVGRNEKRPTKTLENLAGWYHYRWRFCNVRKGNEKGHVERSVEIVRRKAFSQHEAFDTIFEATACLQETCKKLNEQPSTAGVPSAAEKLSEERQGLFAHPGQIECFVSEDLKVDKYATVSFGTNRYSVPDHLVGKRISAKIYSEQLRIYYGDRAVCQHARLYTRNQWSVSMDHYLETFFKKPGAFAGSLALTQAPEIISRLYKDYFGSESREFIELLMYLRDHDITPEALQKATWEAQKLCPNDVRIEKVRVILGNRHPIAETGNVQPGLIESLANAQIKEIAALMNLN